MAWLPSPRLRRLAEASSLRDDRSPRPPPRVRRIQVVVGGFALHPPSDPFAASASRSRRRDRIGGRLDEPATPHGPTRWTAVFGALASFALVAAFFVDWIHVRPDFGTRLREEIESKLTGDVSANAEDWRSLTTELVRKGGVSGLDVFAWTRSARAWSAAANAGVPAAKVPLLDQRTRRGILVLAFVLAALPVGGAVLGLYFVTHRFRRARSPILILAMLLGVAAVGIPAAYRMLEGVIGQETDAAFGLTALSAIGGVLLLVGAFGVKVENWWRVFLGAVATGGALGVLAWFYVAWGVAP